MESLISTYPVFELNNWNYGFINQEFKPKCPAPNSKFAQCRLTFKFEKLYLRFMFVMADNLVFQNPAHRKLAKRCWQFWICSKF